MRKKQWELLGLWAMGLIMFVMTFVVIKLMIDFVTWTALTPDWAQAGGGLLAIVAAFIVGKQQSNAAIAAVYAADRVVKLEQLASMESQIRLAHAMATSIANIFGPTHFNQLILSVRYSEPKLRGLITAIDSIPNERLTTFESVEAKLMLSNALHYLLGNVSRAEARIASLTDVETGASPTVVPFNSAAIELNCDEIRKQCLRLNEYLESKHPDVSQERQSR